MVRLGWARCSQVRQVSVGTQTQRLVGSKCTARRPRNHGSVNERRAGLRHQRQVEPKAPQRYSWPHPAAGGPYAERAAATIRPRTCRSDGFAASGSASGAAVGRSVRCDQPTGSYDRLVSADPAKRLHPQAYDALAEGLATFQWYKPPFSQMMTSLFAGDSSVLAGIDLHARTKREAAREVVSRLQRDERRYQSLTVGVLMTLADYDAGFKHLARLEDGADKVKAAQSALAEIRRVIGRHKQFVENADARRAADAAASAAAAQVWARAQDLEALKADFYRLSTMNDPQRRGLALEPFLNQLFRLFDLDPRAAFALRGEQIDGAFTFDTDDYLLEARWLDGRVDPKQIRDFAGKVAEKAHRTSGLMISMNGFSSEAINLLRRTGSRLLLADGADLAAVLEGAVGLDELLLRKRRHVAETGNPYLGAHEML